MSERLIDIDDQALLAARVELGTDPTTSQEITTASDNEPTSQQADARQRSRRARRAGPWNTLIDRRVRPRRHAHKTPQRPPSITNPRQPAKYCKSANVSSGTRASIPRILLIAMCLALTGCSDSRSTQTQAIDAFPLPETWFEIERETVGESWCTPPFCSYRTRVAWTTQDLPTIDLLREGAQQAHWAEFRIERCRPDDIPHTTTPFCDIRAKHGDIELELLVGRRENGSDSWLIRIIAE